MSATATVGVLDTKLQADTRTFSPKMQEAAEKVDLINRKLQMQASSAALMGDAMDKGASQSARAAAIEERAAERARRAWQREVIQQNLAIDAQRKAARAAELAALKQDILTRSLQKQGGIMAGLKDRFALTSKGVQLSARDWLSAFGPLGELMGVGLIGGLGVEQINKLAAFNVDLEDLSKQSGIAIQPLSGLQLIVKRMGVDWDPVSRGVVRLNHALADAPYEATYARALKEIGVNLKDLNPATTTAAQRLQILAVAFQKHAGTAAAADAAIELFGRGGVELLPILEAEGAALQSNMIEMGKSTGVTDASAAAARRWTADWAMLGTQTKATMMPLLGLADPLFHDVEGIVGAIRSIFISAAAAIVGTTETVINSIRTMAKVAYDVRVGDLGGAWGDLKGGGTSIAGDWREMSGITAGSWKDTWKDFWGETKISPEQPKGSDVDFNTIPLPPDNSGVYRQRAALSYEEAQKRWMNPDIIGQIQRFIAKWNAKKPPDEVKYMWGNGRPLDDLLQRGPQWREYNQQQERAKQIAAQLAQETERTRLQIALEAGAMDKHAAAYREAAIAAQAYRVQMDALREQRGRVAADMTLTKGTQAGQLAQIDNQMAELRGRYQIEAMQADAAEKVTTALGMLGTSLNRTAQQLTEWGSKLGELFSQTLNSTNDQILNAMTGKRTSFGNVGSTFFRGVAKTGLENLEGRAMKALGLSGGMKPDGSEGRPFYVVLKQAAQQQGQQGGLLGKVMSMFGGGGSGAPSIFSSVAGGGAGGILSSILGGGGMGAAPAALNLGTGMSMSGMSSTLAGLPGFAEGGSIPSNLPAIVGEAGPELFVPSSAGRIVPNRELTLGGDTHLHMNIDARGATDPAAVQAAAHRAVWQAAPRIASMALRAHEDRQSRRILATGR